MRLVLHGWYGYRNIGDDLLLEVLTSRLCAQRTVEVIEIGVKDIHSVEWLLRDSRVRLFRRSHLQLVLKAFRADALIVGPGGLFPHRNPLKVLAFLVLSCFWRVLGRKVVFFGIGASGIQDRVSAILWRSLASVANAFLARDTDLFEAAGIPRGSRVFSGADVIFLRDVGDRSALKLPVSGTPSGCVAISFANLFERRNADYDSFVAACVRIVEAVLAEGNRVDLLSFSSPGDEWLNRHIADSINNSALRALDYAETLTQVDRLDHYLYVVAMRFHAVALAVVSGVPLIGISYSHKTESLLRRCGLGKETIRYCSSSSEYYEREIPLASDIVLRHLAQIRRSPSEYTVDPREVGELRKDAESMVACLNEVLFHRSLDISSAQQMGGHRG